LNATSRVLVGHKGAVYGLAFAPDDRTLASAGEDGTLRLWRAPKWEPIAQWTGHNGQAVNGVLFSPKGDYLISSGDDGNLRLWKLAPAGVWQGLLGVSNRGVAPTTVQEFALGGRGRGLAFASLSEDRQYLAAGSPDAPVLVWEVTSEGETWQLTQSGSLEGFLSSISSLALSLDGGLFATGSFLAVQTRRTGDGSLTATLYGPTNWVSSLAFSPAGGVLAGGSGDGKVWLFAVKGGQVTLAQTLTEHTGWVRAVAFSPVENLLASASQDRTVKLWRTTEARAEELYSLGASSPMLSLAFAPDGMLLAGGTVDGQVLFWQTASGKQVNALQGTSGIYAMIFLPGGEYLVTGAEDGMITLWNLKQELQAARLNPGGGIWALSVSPAGDLLAAAYGEEGKVALYDIRDPKNPLLLKDLSGHSSEVSGVAFSRDGLWLVTAAEDGTVVFWGVGN
jgi:WD40 repeat protein